MRLGSLVPRPEKNTSLNCGVLAAHAVHDEITVAAPRQGARRDGRAGPGRPG